MSNIDWSRPLEAYHPVHGACDVKVEYQHARDGCYIVYGEKMHGSCPAGFMPDGQAYVGASNSEKEWKVRNKAESKADIPEWAIENVRVMTGLMEYDRGSNIAGVVNAFARYIMAKEEPPVDPAILAVRKIVAAVSGRAFGQHSVLCGDYDEDEDFQAAVNTYRELERGEVK